MMAANQSLKTNRGQVSKNKKRTGLSGSYAKIKLKPFPKATKAQIKAIRTGMQNESRIHHQKVAVVIMICLLVFIVLFLYNIKT